MLVLPLVLTGCRLTSGTGQAGPPPGGWPQPAGPRVTTSMCGLLTDADYKKLGHDRRPVMSTTLANRTNTVDCTYQSIDAMSLTLEPTSEAARYLFAAGLADHKRQLASGHRTSVLATNPVALADESWFDYWTAGAADQTPPAHEIRARRGALVVGITLSGVRGKKEGDPRSVLTNLADLVLRRLPHVGAENTGTDHKIEYQVIGFGRARSISYEDYTGLETGGEVKNPRIPWLRVVPMATGGGNPEPNPAVLRVETSSNAKVGCLILFDGEPIAGQRPQAGGLVECRGSIPEDEDGESAQPAVFAQGGDPLEPPM